MADVAGVLERDPRLGRRGEIGRAPDQPGYVLRDRVQDHGRAVPASGPLLICVERGDGGVPTFRQLAVLHAV